MLDSLKYFWNNYDFDRLMEWVNDAMVDPTALLLNPYVLVPLIVVLALTFYPKTSPLGQKLMVSIPAVGFIFVTATVLNNDKINHAGPFAMALISAFMVIGWLIWTKLINT